MTFRATIIKAFLASPGDVANERSATRAAIESWNAEHGESQQVVFQAVGWETHTTPEFGNEPQAIINRQALDECDVLIGLLWTTLGSPTKTAPSGTVEEIYRFADSGKDVGLFFSSQPLPPDVNVAGVEMVRTFRDENRERCLYETFSDTNELQRLLMRWLTRQADNHAVALGTVLRSTPALRSSSRITARMTGTSRSHRIEVRNAGTIDVHDVTLSVPEEVGWLDLDAEPIDILRPGDTVKVMCSTHMGGGPNHFDIAIDARDGDGQTIDTQYSKINS